MSPGIKIAKTDAEILACHLVIIQLRPHLGDPARFLAQVKRQDTECGFKLAFLKDYEILAVAGIRLGEWLAGGKYLEIEDLVTADDARSEGFGGRLFDWILDYARGQGCDELKLVSNVTRYGAHRFYLNKRMKIQAYYFSIDLSTTPA
jgi:GNAT superfamily N-acetyltransferase